MDKKAEYVKEAPIEPELWDEPDFETDHAYSIAFVGDPQYITCGDYYLETKKLHEQFRFIADTANERKLEHVFVLGDITDLGYKNDGNLAYAHNSPPITREWEIAKEAISQLNKANVSYSLCRGNHDDYMMDDFFNTPEYTDQFKGAGGFYSDPEGKHPNVREVLNPDAYIYWSAISGIHRESIANSWMIKEICGTKYLFVTVDYNPTEKVMLWLDELLGKYPDHKALITTHSYLRTNRTLCPTEKGETMYPLGFTADIFWEKVYSKHSNVFMIVSGHTGGVQLVHNWRVGDNGNKVLEVLANPQVYDTKEIDRQGTIEHGKQDTGLVLYMNFSEDGKKVKFNYYATLLGKFLKNNDYVFDLD